MCVSRMLGKAESESQRALIIRILYMVASKKMEGQCYFLVCCLHMHYQMSSNYKELSFCKVKQDILPKANVQTEMFKNSG